MLNAILWLIAISVAVTTLLPLTNSVRWWVRMWDFPRIHIVVVAGLTVLVVPFATIPLKPLLISAMLACIFYHAARIYPYMPFARKEIELVAAVGPHVSILAANVLMENTRYGDLIAIIEQEDPDVLFLMETNAVWHDALKATLANYRTIRTHLRDDHYGLIFATRLSAISVGIFYPNGDDTPGVKAVLTNTDGVAFNFIGLHPRPPVPGNDTKARDEQIKNAAMMTSSSERPTICMGDFNDVAWSWTTQRFKRYGAFREPRVGRGMLSSFHTKYWFVRLPIDQLFLTENVGLVAFERLSDFGSDHFPMTAHVVFDCKGPA